MPSPDARASCVLRFPLLVFSRIRRALPMDAWEHFLTFLEVVGRGAQQPSGPHLKEGRLQGLENLADWLANGEHSWLVPGKFHTEPRHSCCPPRLRTKSMIDTKSGGRVRRNMGPCEIQRKFREICVRAVQAVRASTVPFPVKWAWVCVSFAKLSQFQSKIRPISPILCWNQMCFQRTSSWICYPPDTQNKCCDGSHRHSPDWEEKSKSKL